MKKILFCSLITVLLGMGFNSAHAQYQNALGGRFGLANGLTFKTFVKQDKALDFILNFQSRSEYSDFRFTALYEIHNPINSAPGLRWYYGFGGTVGSKKYKATDDNEVVLGIDGVLGLDYKFNGAPINLALDWKPTYFVTPNTEFDGQGLGLSLRFTF